MPIVRSYFCEACAYTVEQTLPAESWEAPPPECPKCAAGRMGQDYKPPAIVGSTRARAVAEAERIAAEDYGVSNMWIEGKEGVRNKVEYKEKAKVFPPSAWNGNREVLEGAIAVGRQTRQQYGSGLDVLQNALKSGAQPDLIENSKRRMKDRW